ncbi:outer membrane protein [Methylobacterium sp. Leaf118]|uniref:outer membrane protein n=1 Tax=Methylobacterium sp. Leaf118 TaxID=2876562 RepID=UPI001E414F01|nr:outer membrane beta-barrel protein [Methylobacterium sp. Leaf118]
MATAAGAADLPLRAAPAPVFVALDWSGFYIGAHLGTVVDGGRGGTFASGDGGLIPSPNFGGRGGRTGNAVGTLDGRDLFSGGHAGYNWQTGRLVVGVEGDVSSLGRLDDILVSGRARLGFGTPQFLIYGTAGIAYLSQGGGLAGVFVGGNGGGGGNGGAVAGLGGDGGGGGNGFSTLTIPVSGGDRIGFVGGAGFETRLSPQVGAGIEALYHVFDGAPLGGFARDVLTVRGRLTFHLTPSDLTDPPREAGDSRWAGAYAGGHFGAAHSLSANAIDRTALAPGEAGAPGTRGIDGGGGGGGAVAFAGLRRKPSVIGGVHLGYNWQAGHLVYGGEADASFADNATFETLGSVRGRLGFLSAGVLFYGTAGVAINRDAGFRGIFAENGGPGGDGGGVLAPPGGAGGTGGRAFALRNRETQVGFVVGAGLEAKITERLTAGAEALYYDLGDARPVALPPTAGRFFTAGSGTEAFVLRTRLSYSFATP